MKRLTILVLNLSLLTSVLINAQITPAEKGLSSITPDVIKSQLGFLASDWTEGRMAGEKGEAISADYIASILQLAGVIPGGDMPISGGSRSYFQNFMLTRSMPGEEQILKVKSVDGKLTKTTSFIFNTDFTIRYYGQEFEAEAPVVFAGYCYKNEKLGYNDFKSIDVKGKFVMRIPGIPPSISKKITTEEASAYNRGLEAELLKLGAIGIIDINTNAITFNRMRERSVSEESKAEGTPRPGYPSGSYSIPSKITIESLVRLSVTEKAASDILSGSGVNPDDYISKTNAGETYSLQQKEKQLYLKTSVNNKQIAVKNILGIIPGNNPDKVIVLGAHYDHMGMGNGYIWNGADDNGSGTVGVMTIARAIMATGKKPEKTIIVALWTAEEEGLLGSRYWIQNPTTPLKNVVINVNFDMISRYINETDQKKVTMTYTDAYPVFKDFTVANLKTYGIDLLVDYQPSPDPPGGTDHRSFVAAGIPVMRFKPGHREEYHTPKDELGTIDWDIMEKIIKISFLNIMDLSEKSW
jgi:hypothetical protein